MGPSDIKLICEMALQLQLGSAPADDGPPSTPAKSQDIADVALGTISADEFFKALKLIIGNDSDVLDKKKCKKNVALSQGGRAHLPAVFNEALEDFEGRQGYIARFKMYPQLNMLPKTSKPGTGKIRTASTADYRKGAATVIEKMEQCAHEDPGCIALGLGCLPDRVVHTARSDHVIRLPRFSAPVGTHVTPLADNLDCGETGALTTQHSTVMGTSIYKIVILGPEPDPVSPDNQHIVISHDCQGFEVGHLFYGIIPHPTSQGVAMSRKNLGDNVAFIKRLFNRDTCGNATLYLQKGHAKATNELSHAQMSKAATALGFLTKRSLDGIALTAAHVASNAS